MAKEKLAQDLLADGAVTIAEAVKWSGIGKTRLYDEMKAGRLQYSQIGSRRLIPRKALRALLERGLADG